jgi:hypothetical protein
LFHNVFGILHRIVFEPMLLDESARVHESIRAMLTLQLKRNAVENFQDRTEHSAWIMTLGFQRAILARLHWSSGFGK